MPGVLFFFGRVLIGHDHYHDSAAWKSDSKHLAYIRWRLLLINLMGVPAFVTVWRLKGVIW